MKTRYATGQIAGNRHDQEDSLQVGRPVHTEQLAGQLFLLADGMGGHASGKLASQLVCETANSAFHNATGSIPERLQSALTAAHERIVQAQESVQDRRGTGATLLAVWIGADHAYWLSVGDSPLWLLRGTTLTRLNQDHSMRPVFAKLVETGQMTQEALETDAKRHALRSAITGNPIRMVDAPAESLPLYPHDTLLLGSDGVETLSEAELTALLGGQADEQTRLTAVLQAIEAKARPEQDNASAILISLYGHSSQDTAPTTGTDNAKQHRTAPNPTPAKADSGSAAVPHRRAHSRRWWVGLLIISLLLATAALIIVARQIPLQRQTPSDLTPGPVVQPEPTSSPAPSGEESV
jgi:protein phosphatase